MARRCFGLAAARQDERDAAALGQWLARRDPIPPVLNARDLRRMADGPPVNDPGRLDAALAGLAEAGWLRPESARDGQSKGRPRKDWAVNPKLAGPMAAFATASRRR
jgi:hypothetical protein